MSSSVSSWCTDWQIVCFHSCVRTGGRVWCRWFLWAILAMAASGVLRMQGLGRVGTLGLRRRGRSSNEEESCQTKQTPGKTVQTRDGADPSLTLFFEVLPRRHHLHNVSHLSICNPVGNDTTWAPDWRETFRRDGFGAICTIGRKYGMALLCGRYSSAHFEGFHDGFTGGQRQAKQ